MVYQWHRGRSVAVGGLMIEYTLHYHHLNLITEGLHVHVVIKRHLPELCRDVRVIYHGTRVVPYYHDRVTLVVECTSWHIYIYQ